MADELDIKNVPASPGTSLDLMEIYNPLLEDFVWAYDGKPYTIPANSKKQFPEFLTRHFALHLARKIVYGNHEAEAIQRVQEMRKIANYDPSTDPSVTKAVPMGRVEKMMDWILNPVGKSPETFSGQEETKLDAREKRLKNLEKARAVRQAKLKAVQS